MNVFDRLNQRAFEELDRVRRQEQMMGIDVHALTRKQELLGYHSAAYEALSELSRNSAYRLAIDHSIASPLTETARAASLSALEMHTVAASRLDLTDHMSQFSRGWVNRICLFDEPLTLAIKGALDTHISCISEMSVLAESSLARFKWDQFGGSLCLDDSARSILRDQFLGFSHSYESLLASLSDSQPIMLSLPPFASELPAREFFLGSRLVKAISIVAPEDDLEEESEELQREINASVEDELQSMVGQLDPELVVMVEGARRALRSRNPDRVRHVITSYRELCMHVLHRLSPDEAIEKWSNSPDDYWNGRPKRKTRLLYICRNINHGPFTEFMDRDIDTMVNMFDLLNKGTHEVKTNFTEYQLQALRSKAESTVHFMLTISREETDAGSPK